MLQNYFKRALILDIFEVAKGGRIKKYFGPHFK